MTTRAVRRLRVRSTLKPRSTSASPETRDAYDRWNCSVVGRFRRWHNRGRRGPCPVALHWVASFDDFLADVGSCPDGHNLVPVDPSEPLGPMNYRWKPSWRRPASTSTQAEA